MITTATEDIFCDRCGRNVSNDRYILTIDDGKVGSNKVIQKDLCCNCASLIYSAPSLAYRFMED